MFDALKDLTGGKSKLVEKQAAELERLIATAREERSAISTMLTTLATRSAKLTPLGKTLEQVGEKATGVATRLDEIADRPHAVLGRRAGRAVVHHRPAASLERGATCPLCPPPPPAGAASVPVYAAADSTVAREHGDPSFEAANSLASSTGTMGRRTTGRRANRVAVGRDEPGRLR